MEYVAYLCGILFVLDYNLKYQFGFGKLRDPWRVKSWYINFLFMSGIMSLPWVNSHFILSNNFQLLSARDMAGIVYSRNKDLYEQDYDAQRLGEVEKSE